MYKFGAKYYSPEQIEEFKKQSRLKRDLNQLTAMMSSIGSEAKVAPKKKVAVKKKITKKVAVKNTDRQAEIEHYKKLAREKRYKKLLSGEEREGKVKASAGDIMDISDLMSRTSAHFGKKRFY
jgi:hypothetical protein